jgi:hypothetical protein
VALHEGLALGPAQNSTSLCKVQGGNFFIFYGQKFLAEGNQNITKCCSEVTLLLGNFIESVQQINKAPKNG